MPQEGTTTYLLECISSRRACCKEATYVLELCRKLDVVHCAAGGYLRVFLGAERSIKPCPGLGLIDHEMSDEHDLLQLTSSPATA